MRARRGVARADEAIEEGRIGGPGFVERVAGDPARGEAQAECDDDDVVEWPDDGNELGDEVDRGDGPNGGEAERQLGGAGNPGITAEVAHGGNGGGNDAQQVFECARREAAGPHREESPTDCHDGERDEQPPEHVRQCISRKCNACYMSAVTKWVIVVVRFPAEPSRHRVAAWRELRKAGGVSLGAGVWALVGGPSARRVVERLRSLAEAIEGAGEVLVLEAKPSDVFTAEVLVASFRAERDQEWAEFGRDCAKFLAEIDKEIRIEKFTAAELEEEEHSLERLRRWHGDLAARDVMGGPSASAAAARLDTCVAKLDDYTARVYRHLGHDR